MAFSNMLEAIVVEAAFYHHVPGYTSWPETIHVAHSNNIINEKAIG